MTKFLSGMNTVNNSKPEITGTLYKDVHNEINTVANNYIHNKIYEGIWIHISSIIILNKHKINQLVWSEYYFKLYPSYVHNSSLTSLKSSYT